ncbi:hypothetical protein J5N97_000857 [Dioscorea zingiberensis]|uniref:Secreted protein n=1 Tax=Dioscorea zingiberensis TaxID=325984 RepID=A0A9D5H2R7_9LILI|nr:hypothetical protein J5N97_001659 [Dioscorea zingiberensis]KAJ0961173.1 hypothetical protein J5N97_000857 [Dioscorea zingiberensis]
MLQLFFAVAFSAAPLTLYVPPMRNLNLFVEALESFIHQTSDYSVRVFPRARLGFSRVVAALRRIFFL